MAASVFVWEKRTVDDRLGKRVKMMADDVLILSQQASAAVRSEKLRCRSLCALGELVY